MMVQLPLQEKQLKQQTLANTFAHSSSSSHPCTLPAALCNISGYIAGTTLPTADSSCLVQLQPAAALKGANTATVGSTSAVSCKPQHVLLPLRPESLQSKLPATQPVPVLGRHNARRQQQQLLLQQHNQLQKATAAEAVQPQAGTSADSSSTHRLQAYSPPCAGTKPPGKHVSTAEQAQAASGTTQQPGPQTRPRHHSTPVQQLHQQLLHHQGDQVCSTAVAVKLRLSGAQQQRQQLLEQHAAAAAAARMQRDEAVAAVSAGAAATLLANVLVPQGGGIPVAAAVACKHIAGFQTAVAAAATPHLAEDEYVEDLHMEYTTCSSIATSTTADDMDTESDAGSATKFSSDIATHASIRLRSCSSSTPPAAVQASAEAALHQSILLQLLQKAATTRKGCAVLTADPVAAAAAGAASVRGRLLITELAVYSRTAKQLQHAVIRSSGLSCGCSAADLQLANRIMATIALPGGVTYVPVKQDSRIFCAGASWRIPAFAICLASSYMQRIASKQPCLAAAAASCIGFHDYAHHMAAMVRGRATAVAHLSSHQAAQAQISLRIAKCICLFLALKVADSMHALGLLRFMISQVTGNPAPSRSDVEAYEIAILDLLEWRLGPFFAEDAEARPGADERMWAEAVVQCWDF